MKCALNHLNVHGKAVLMRVDFNVPLEESGCVRDDSRIRLSLPSIQYILGQGGRLILISHLGRPKGEKNPKLTLKPIATHLSTLLDQPVQFSPTAIGKEVHKRCDALQNGQVLLLENIRFYIGEERPDRDPTLVKKIAILGSVYVNDAFATAHRVHTSTALLPQEFPNCNGMGFLMEREVAFFSRHLQMPQRPFCAIIGGSKVSTKIRALKALIQAIDALFIGGGMAFTFAKCQGISIGDSLLERDHLCLAQTLLDACKSRAIPVYLPQDFVIAKGDLSPPLEHRLIEASRGIPKGWQGVDIGPHTINNWGAHLEKAKAVFWNGPMGIFELPPFAKGTHRLAALLSTCDCTSVVGGGDSIAAIKEKGMQERFTHLSSGGGASLEYIAFGRLPAIDALSDREG